MAFQANAQSLQVAGINIKGTGRDATVDFGVNDCAILAESDKGVGILGNCDEGCGVVGIYGPLKPWADISLAPNPAGVVGASQNGPGVKGISGGTGVQGTSQGTSFSNAGVAGNSIAGTGTKGSSDSGVGVYGYSFKDTGVLGASGDVHVHSDTTGVEGRSQFGWGVMGWTLNPPEGVGGWFSNVRYMPVGRSDVWVPPQVRIGTRGTAGHFEGNVEIFGNLSKSGGGFKIDHPVEPNRKYLSHSFVESPDMKNVYDGIATLDGKGEAVVQLPKWFGALNKDFRYQLTAMGSAAPNLHISKQIAQNRFKIAGGKPRMKVSWQVTGIRQDAWARANRVPVEETKSAKERGRYIHPELYDKKLDRAVITARFPKQIERMIKSLGQEQRGRKGKPASEDVLM